ncbi:MAG: hypothetical protein GY822_28615 [Deltaproteobacteria bacterium]|nr:hypothetical protein [Deltaproteobacteria bacterium]
MRAKSAPHLKRVENGFCSCRKRPPLKPTANWKNFEQLAAEGALFFDEKARRVESKKAQKKADADQERVRQETQSDDVDRMNEYREMLKQTQAKAKAKNLKEREEAAKRSALAEEQKMARNEGFLAQALAENKAKRLEESKALPNKLTEKEPAKRRRRHKNTWPVSQTAVKRDNPIVEAKAALARMSSPVQNPVQSSTKTAEVYSDQKPPTGSDVPIRSSEPVSEGRLTSSGVETSQLSESHCLKEGRFP